MKKTKVLYVEDETFLAKIVSETLESRGYEVVLEEDGGKAFQRFSEIKPDVCVLDIMLPNKDGFTIADEIRDKDTDVPIIFLSAKSQTADVVSGFKTGANDYIRKPFSMEELIVRIENVLRHKIVATGEQDEVNIGAYTFNMKRQTLNHPDEGRKLSYRESELLKLLYENRDKIVERSEILTLLWGSDSFFNSRTLDVYITKLRGYLKHDPAIEIITIKGIGYRFVMG
ncbi:response regulator transcription factor [Flavisolibacter ginsenosidimutans]|uniref:Response regulator transcription factor n=1 Tax=Flavisolibacter ginsenosidimutans TaxID=661481 RepID=A0A5B8UMP1_9BACT|nr:response regulator transcription factor [Flavisolibacter ginsenosidimutans]QEC57642.1 response regulator transcription factor [Flavisolibacter ginsenosidimutans]